MSGKQLSSNEASVDAQTHDTTVGGAAEFPVVEETPAFRPSVEQEKQAKVDANPPEGIGAEFSHLPLAQEERIRAREEELEHISRQAAFGVQEGRAEGTRTVVEARQRAQRAERAQRDPREELSREELADVNRAADRITDQLDGGVARAAVSRRLGERLRSGQALTSAVFGTMGAMKAEPGTVCPIVDVPDTNGGEVTVSGEIIQLWKPSSPEIEQVGLIADEPGKIKWTSWVKSDPRIVREYDVVRMRGLKKNWYRGRCSLAVTYDSHITFPERDTRWWE